MTAQADTTSRAPRYVTFLNPIAKRLLAAGAPMGPNALVTVRGRKTGTPRTTPVAIIRVAGRRWIWSPWGDVHWVRNLRTAGRATVTSGGRSEEVTARELDGDERVRFFAEVLGPVARAMPLGVAFVRVVDGVDVNRPAEAAQGRAVFELQRVT